MTEKLRVYLYFDEAVACSGNESMKKGRPTLKHKVILSTAEDQAQSCTLLIKKYCDKYNAQADLPEDHKLAPETLQLKLDTTIIKANSQPITSYISDYNDVHVVFLPASALNAAQHEEGSVPCTNFGCGKRFVPGRDDQEPKCRYHEGRPVFHDTYKYWSCCKEKRTMEFSEFEQIEPCAVGLHKHDPVKAAVAVSGGAASSSSAAGAMELDRKPLSPEEIAALEAERYGASASPASSSVCATDASSPATLSPSTTSPATRGPREFDAFASQKNGQKEPQKPNAEGKYRCRRHACGKLFHPDENNDTACSYHAQGPVFHDTYKYWACCPDKKSDDFDVFAKVPGCNVGSHLA